MTETSSAPGKQKSWSVKRRLTLLYIVSAFGILLVSTAFLYWVLTSRLVKEDGQFLAAKVSLLREILKEEPNDREVLQEEIKWETAPFRLAKYYARILTPDGKIVIETDGMLSIAPVGIFPKPASLSKLPARAIRRKSQDGHNLLLMSALARVGNAAGQTRILQLALDISHEDELIADYRQQLLLVLIAGIILSAVVGVFIAGKGLKPIEDITTTVKHISADQLHRRVGQPDQNLSRTRLKSGWPVELSDLAAAFDGMLDRLEDSFNRLSQFSADLAHELRTPINNLIGETEVALSRERTMEEYREVLVSGLEEYSRLSHVIESLLFLARAESPETRIDKQKLDPGKEIGDVVEYYEPIAEEQGITIEYSKDTGDSKVNADPTLLRQALSNLVSNSVRHTGRGGKVEIAVKRGDDNSVTISVADTGEGIGAEHLSRIFDRFYRADSSRSEHKAGSGLGLAIVKSIMQLHGGRASVVSEKGKGTKVSLIFPG